MLLVGLDDDNGYVAAADDDDGYVAATAAAAVAFPPLTCNALSCCDVVVAFLDSLRLCNIFGFTPSIITIVFGPALTVSISRAFASANS